MNFNSLSYLLFLVVNVVVYYILPYRFRNGFLLLSSYYFYMCWNPVYALLMLFSTAVTYGCGRLTGSAVLGKRKLWVGLSLFLNLSILFFFKYYNFAADTLGKLLSLTGVFLELPDFSILLPVGISFYTFQALGYTIDVYRGTVEAEKNFIRYALFVSFFPQLVAGPIERSDHMLGQFQEKHTFSLKAIEDGVLPVLWGLFLKMVLADNLAVMVNKVYDASARRSGWELLLATAGFGFQVYCDFYGYSLIARGSARMLGFSLMDNFNAPYLSRSIGEFWRRWHISLSSWFRDYLYIPLGGNRKGKGKKWRNILVVFSLSGLWHGAGLTYLAWGVLNGGYQIISGLTMPLRKPWQEKWKQKGKAAAGCLAVWQTAATFFFTLLAWVLFRASSLSQAGQIYLQFLQIPWQGLAIAPRALGLSLPEGIMVLCCLAILWMVDYFKWKGKTFSFGPWIRYAIWFLLIAGILIFGSYGSGYDPQAFVYFQF